MDFEQIFYTVVIGLWIAGVVLYIWYFRKSFIQKRKENEEQRSKRKLGKRCPQCRNIINYKRTVCQHCGYQFPEVSTHDYHPGQRKKKRGKRCPQCGNIINYKREVCQHCGYKFGVDKPGAKSGDTPEQEQKVSN